jgi:magnesium-transporting ATPase (P-type)
VVGDILLVEAGMRIPADCILIEAMDLTVDEALYHEDRETVKRKWISEGSIEENNHTENPDPFLLTNSLVMTGSGKAIVCSVGSYRLINTIKDEVEFIGDDENENTPLQTRLTHIANYLSKWGYTAGFCTFIAMTTWLIIEILFTSQTLLENETLTKAIDFFSIAVAIIIVAVPEGLPLSVSIAMAFSIDKLKNDNLLVKNI